MKYYNPSNNFKAPIPREPKPYKPPQGRSEEIHPVKEVPIVPIEKQRENDVFCEKSINKKSNLFGNLSRDDMIILGVLFLLLFNDCDDYLLLLALGYIFLSSKQDKKSFGL